MKNLIFAFTGLFSLCAFTKSFTIYEEGETSPVKTVKLEESVFSQDCEDKKCQAYQSFSSPKKAALKSGKLMGNPASKFCQAQGGKGIILRDSKNRQYDFCRFKDGSFVDAWRLYEKR